MANRPVFLIASERSGTNLLRKRLTDSQAYYFGPSPAHFLKNLYYREPFYGDLAEDARFKALVEDALALCFVHFSPWDIKLDADTVLRDYGDRKRDVVHLADYLMTRYAESKGFTSYFCKDNSLYEFALDLARQLPDARFIYLYRDPRDFVLSQRKRPKESQSVIKHAKLWDFEQVKAIKVARQLEREGRCALVSYEELVQDEEAVLARICQFLGVERAVKAARTEDKIVDQVHEWKNLGGETLKNNFGKFQKEMSEKEIARVEVICAMTMQHLGYPRVTSRKRGIGHVERLLDTAWCTFRQLLAKSTAEKVPAVVDRAKLLKRLHVNYKSPR